VSPILVRPVREQLEHDRVIRLLHGKSRRRYEAAMNPGAEQNASVRAGTTPVYPDLVLYAPGRGRRVQAVVEVETGESVNHLEALAEWAQFGRLRVPFILYVPSTAVEMARRICEEHQIQVSELWSYHAVGDQLRFTLMHRSRVVEPPTARPPARVAAPRTRRTTASRAGKSARAIKPVRKARSQKRR
jgi:hypothetical protein